MQWYYSEGGERRGPLSQDELGALIARGSVTADDFVWRDGMGDWVRSADAPELAQWFRAAPSAPAGGSYPPQAPPPGSVPPGSVPPGSAPLGSVPLGSVPLGSAPPYGRSESMGQGSGMSHDRSSYDSASYTERPTTNSLAVAALIMGILSMCCGCLLGLPAVICGHIAHSQVKASDGRQTGGGMAIAGFILGYFGILAGTVWIILNVLMESSNF